MNLKNHFLLIVLVVSTFPLLAQNVKERVQNNVQIAEGKKNLERDTRELAAFKAKVVNFDAAFENRNLAEVGNLKLSILADMKREVEQSKVKAAKARKEIAQSSAEVRSDRRELKRDRKDSNSTRRDKRDDQKDMARDKANKRDDKRDRRDDIRDQKSIVDRLEKQSGILQKLTAYSFSFDAGALQTAAANKVLIGNFVQTMRADIVATKQELSEDMRENREDRRETRDDIKEHKEKNKRGSRRDRN